MLTHAFGLFVQNPAIMKQLGKRWSDSQKSRVPATSEHLATLYGESNKIRPRFSPCPILLHYRTNKNHSSVIGYVEDFAFRAIINRRQVGGLGSCFNTFIRLAEGRGVVYYAAGTTDFRSLMSTEERLKASGGG